jgi:hypothetical protein
MPPFSFNSKPGSPSNSVGSSESVEDIINDPVFCNTKDGEICFCESLEGLSVEDYGIDQTLFSTIGRYEFDHKIGIRMWIINTSEVAQCSTSTTSYSNTISCNDTSQTSRKCCPTLPLPELSEWQLQRQENYYTPLPSPIATTDSSVTHHHPLNLKWILGDNNGDENSDESV